MKLTSKRHKITSALLTCIITVTLGSFSSAASEPNLSNQVDLAKPVQKISGWIAGQTDLSESQKQFVGSWVYKHFDAMSDVTCTAFYKVGAPTKQLRVLRQRAENVCAEVNFVLPDAATKVVVLASKMRSNQGQIYARLNLLNIDNQPSDEELATLASFVSKDSSGCPVYNFDEIFNEDYFGKRWGRGKEPFTISWTVNTFSISGDPTTRQLNQTELGWIRLAMESWDKHLSSFQLVESDNPNSNIRIGLVSQITSTQILGPAAYFTANSTPSGQRIRATIALNATFKQYRHKDFFIHAIQHEMGNILGLGDILPSHAFSSVQEDPWSAPIGPIPLSDWDIGMMRQVYGESTCPESWR
jgi:hypothetical protein